MTDHTALWALFVLLFVLFVLVVVTARRGPWQRPEPNPFVPTVLRVPAELLGQIRYVPRDEGNIKGRTIDLTWLDDVPEGHEP